jgi:hypothetical protein
MTRFVDYHKKAFPLLHQLREKWSYQMHGFSYYASNILSNKYENQFSILIYRILMEFSYYINDYYFLDGNECDYSTYFDRK